MDLLNKGFITYEEALAQSSNPDDFALRVKGITATSDAGWKDFEKAKETTTKKDETKMNDIERF
jgi:twitching motility protein PilT